MDFWNPVTIATFDQPIEAELARGMLESEGIRTFVADANTIGMQPYYSRALGGVRLQVDGGDAMRARTLLAPEAADVLPVSAPEEVCVECGADALRSVPPGNLLVVLLSWLLLGLPLLFMKKRYVCKRCGALQPRH